MSKVNINKEAEAQAKREAQQADRDAAARAAIRGERVEAPLAPRAKTNEEKSRDVARAPSSAVINGESAPVWNPQNPAEDFARGARGEHLQGTTEPAIPGGNHNSAPKDPDHTDPAVRTHNEAKAG